MSKEFRPWKIDEAQLLPPSVQDYVQQDHVSRLIVSLVLSAASLMLCAPLTKALATSRALEAGQPLKAGDLEMVAWPASTPLTGGFTKIADVVGRAVLYPLAKDQPIDGCAQDCFVVAQLLEKTQLAAGR